MLDRKLSAILTRCKHISCWYLPVSFFLSLFQPPNPANFEMLAKVFKLFKVFVSQFEDWFVIGLNFSISISLDFGTRVFSSKNWQWIKARDDAGFQTRLKPHLPQGFRRLCGDGIDFQTSAHLRQLGPEEPHRPRALRQDASPDRHAGEGDGRREEDLHEAAGCTFVLIFGSYLSESTSSARLSSLESQGRSGTCLSLLGNSSLPRRSVLV